MMIRRHFAHSAVMAAMSATAFVSLPCEHSLADYQSARAAYLRGDFASAFELALPSALEGDPKSRFGLGLLFARGHGVKTDFVRSYSWFDMVAAQPGPEYRLVRMLALINREYLEKQMSAEQIAKARLRTAMMLARPEAITEPSQFGFSLASHAEKAPSSPTNGSEVVNRVAMTPSPEGNRAPMALLHPPTSHYWIQLAALPVGSTERLRSEWSRLSSQHVVLGALRPSLIRMNLGDFGVYEGLRAGPFDGTTQADVVCNVLRESGEDCFVVTK